MERELRDGMAVRASDDNNHQMPDGAPERDSAYR